MIRYNSMFEQNEIAIAEIYNSIDGECFHSGQITTFVRLVGCNCRCQYPCDLSYTWGIEEYRKAYGALEPIWKSAQELYDAVEEMNDGFPYKSICLTGGEPLLEENKDYMLKELLPLFVSKGYAVNIKTNGSIDYTDYKKAYPNATPIDLYGNRKGVSLLMDWKLPSSGENSKMLEVNLKLLQESDVIKFVISDDERDWIELERICKMNLKAQKYLSPCWGRLEKSKIPEFIKQHPSYNCIAQVQIHKIFWDPTKKGV